MNIEFETKSILRSGLKFSDKVFLIGKFANFKEKDILKAVNTRFEDDNDIFSKIYGVLVKRNNNGKQKRSG